MSEARVRLYQLLMEAQEQIALARYARGVENQTVLAAIDAAQDGPAEAERCEDLYFSTLATYVEALHGRLEIHVVFPEETVVIRRDRV